MSAIPDEQAALLRAIVGHPDDDTPRLVYADWLDEHDQAEQAGFIRDSIRLAGMAKHDQNRKELVERLRALADERCYDWYGPLGIDEDVVIDRYDRGFPSRVTFDSAAAIFVAADRLFEFVPIRGLEVTSHGGRAEGDEEFDNDTLPLFGALPGLARLTDLRLYDHSRIADRAWGEFFQSPHLANLTYLGLVTCGIYDLEAIELAAAVSLSNLTDLDLSHNSIGVNGAQALLDSPHLTKLKRLWLDHNFFGQDEGEDEIFAAWEERLGEGFLPHDSPEDEGEAIE